MRYKKIRIELVVIAEDAEIVAKELDIALDQLEEKHTLFGGEIETSAFHPSGTRRRSALSHTRAAGETVGFAMRSTRKHLGNALRAVI